MPDLSDDIETAATEPLKASVDGQSAESHPLPDLIAADKYLANKTALTGTGNNGGPVSGWATLRPATVRPPGGV